MRKQDVEEQKSKNLAIEDVANEYGGSESYWRREVWRKRLRIVQLGSRIFIPRSEIERYLEERTHLHGENAGVQR